MIINVQNLMSYKFDKWRKNKVGRQMLPSTGENSILERIRARYSCDIGDLLVYFICALDCVKQVIFMINLI